MSKKISITVLTLLLVFVLVVPVGAAKKIRNKAKSKKSYGGSGGYGDTYIGGGYKYVSLEHFGIRLSNKKGFYKSAGAATGTVVDPAKTGYADVFHNAQMGDRVEANYLGNGQVQVRNTRSGESATIEVREKAR